MRSFVLDWGRAVLIGVFKQIAKCVFASQLIYVLYIRENVIALLVYSFRKVLQNCHRNFEMLYQLY